MNKTLFAFKYWLAWILLFQIARLFFILYNFQETLYSGILEIAKSFFYGLRMDASIASYIVIPVCLVLLFTEKIGVNLSKKILSIYSILILIPISLIILSDMPAYQTWGYRLDATPLKYLKYPTEAMTSLGNLPVWGLFTGWLFSILLSYKGFNRLINSNQKKSTENEKKWMPTVLLFFFMLTMIIPLRGGFQLAPINQSAVYFSKSHYANLTAINVCWNFFHSLSHHTYDDRNPFEYLDKKLANQMVDSLTDKKNNCIQFVDLKNHPKPNVIVIVWESFTKKVVDNAKNGVAITPGFNQLKHQGIYFSDIYATGDRTDKGIVGVLSGYPAQPITSIIKIPQKAEKLPTLPAIFSKEGYHSSFYYGGELEFANMKSYLMGCTFNKFISKPDFQSKDESSDWGADDGVVMKKLINDLKTEKSPFFTTWLTLSSHQPYKTPVPTAIQGNDDESLFFNALHYTDDVVTTFINECKKQPFWKNTIVIIVADHGHRLPLSKDKINDFKIPMLWLGGALSKEATQIDQTGSQIDLSSTLLNQLGWSDQSFHWSKNLLTANPLPWAYFSFNNGFGWVKNNSNYFIYDNVGKMMIEQKGIIDNKDILQGRAMEQVSFADYLSK